MAAVQVIEQYIDITPDVCGGRPRIAGTRMTVADIALMRLQMNLSLEEIAGVYDLPLSAVYIAMAYYFDHRAEIDQRSAQDTAFIDELREQYPSKVQAKLDAAHNHAA
jgi:uncharacterized protein (DUF433 family)